MLSDNNIKMVRLGLDDEERQYYFDNKISIKKRIGYLNAQARQNSKSDSCYTCKKECSSFCNSHSVPQFCLKKIAINGKVYFSVFQQVVPYFGEDSGVKEAGTFRLICRECDSKLFHDYEDPEAYSRKPTGKMLAQIVMKNVLLMISKRREEREFYYIIKNTYENLQEYAEHQLQIINLDLADYSAAFDRAKIAINGNHDDWYYLCYYKRLDYVVPFAFQGPITLISDFDDILINNIYNMSPNYHTQQIHIAVFPLKNTSIIMIIIDNREKMYRKFYRKLNSLSSEEQLSIINYIIFSYSENVYISKEIGDDVLHNKQLLDVCQKCSMAEFPKPIGDALPIALDEFSISKHNSIPNLLSKDYALSDHL